MLLWRVVTSWAAVLAFLLVTATAAGAITAPLGSLAVRGLDVSAYQHAGRPINWRLLARDGIRFVGIKASEGTYYTNPYLTSDARAAAAAGLSVVPYVFANPRRASGAATARFSVAAARYARGAGRLPLEVDLENDPYTATDHAGDCYGLSVPRVIAWIAAFTATARAMTGKPPIIYTTADWWQECTGGTAWFRRDPLWLAAYGTAAPECRHRGRSGRSGSTPTTPRCPAWASSTLISISRPRRCQHCAGRPAADAHRDRQPN